MAHTKASIAEPLLFFTVPVPSKSFFFSPRYINDQIIYIKLSL